MVVLGLVLLVGAGVFAASVITSNTGAVGGDLWGLHVSNISLAAVFLAGLAAGAVALLGLVMMFAGSRRSRRLRRERRELARENARLSQHVESADARTDTTAGPGRQVGPDGVPVNRDGVPVNRDGVPVNRDGVPMDDRTDRLNPEREVGYQSPPPPSYDRTSIEADRRHVANDGYTTDASGEPVTGDAPRRRF